MTNLQTPEYIELRDLILKSERFSHDLCDHSPHYKVCEECEEFQVFSLDRVLMALGKIQYKDFEVGSGWRKAFQDITMNGFTLGQPLHEQPLETIKKLLNILKT